MDDHTLIYIIDPFNNKVFPKFTTIRDFKSRIQIVGFAIPSRNLKFGIII